MQQLQATTAGPCGYSADTEILTRSGWVTFDKLTCFDEVAAQAPDRAFQWEYPADVTWHQYAEPMLHFRSQVFDLLVTPDHPLLTYPKAPAGLQAREIPAFRSAQWFTGTRARGKNFPMPLTSRWKGSAPEVIVIPGVVIPKRGQHHPARKLEIPVATWMRFLGWFISEGSLCSAHHLRNQISVAQLRDEHKPDIRATLQGMGVSFREPATGFEFNQMGR